MLRLCNIFPLENIFALVLYSAPLDLQSFSGAKVDPSTVQERKHTCLQGAATCVSCDDILFSVVSK